jgi:hypothetical protein
MGAMIKEIGSEAYPGAASHSRTDLIECNIGRCCVGYFTAVLGGRLRDIHTVLSIALQASPPDFASFSQSQK